MNKKILSVGEAAEVLGVSDETVRNLERDGKIKPFYTNGGHRRYYKIDIEKLAGMHAEPSKDIIRNRVAIYCRVSSSDQKQKGDLERQVGRMTTEALKKGYNIVAVFDEVGSGMNDNRKKLHQLFELVRKKDIDIVFVEHKDRLSRFCCNYLTSYFESFGVKIEFAEEVLPKSYEAELVEDIVSLMASFSARLYGKRSHKNKEKKLTNV